MPLSSTPEPGLFVIFGGTGDLARRKLLPAVARLGREGRIATETHVLAVATDPLRTDESYRDLVRQALVEAGIATDAVEPLLARVHYQPIGQGTFADYQAIAARCLQLEASFGLPGNRAFYLALPPQVFVSTIDGLGSAGLNKSRGWTRLVVEKPFGHDHASAAALNRVVHAWYDEKNIYRIDHYLGKDTVQNLLVLRFANTIFESSWNRDRVEAVQITVAENLGVGSRAGYYDRSGCFRDMVQNHLTQLLTLVAMEVPSAYEADAIRYEKTKVLRSLRPIRPTDVVYGQYAKGLINDADVPAYVDEPGVASGTSTETFVAGRVFIDNWRWQGVPFYFRTGKRLAKSVSQIAVRLRNTPASLFDKFGEPRETADVLVITLQPDAGFSLHFDVKVPGAPFRMVRIPLGFKYRELFDEAPEAYETLLLDVLEGDQTLFVHADEVDLAWRYFTPLLETPPAVFPYTAGSWGPEEAAHLAIDEPELWGQRSPHTFERIRPGSS